MDNRDSRAGKLGTTESHQEKIKESAREVLKEGKKLANDFYQESVDKVNEEVGNVEENIQEYSDLLIKKIRANPLSSVLIAVGVGVVLSSFLKK